MIQIRRRRPGLFTTSLISFVTLFAGVLSCQGANSTGPSTPEDAIQDGLAPTTSRETLLGYINAPIDGRPRYEHWDLFPGSGVGDPLGLPVHGRFTTIHANAIAREAAKYWTQPSTLDEFVDFPVGSIIVKANTFLDPKSNPKLPPGVLTIMYKPGLAGYCQTRDYWSAEGCYGGGWMFVFYEVPEGPLEKVTHHADLGADVVVRDFCVTCHASGSNDDYLRSLQRLRRAAQPATRVGSPPGTPPSNPSDDPFCNNPTLSPVLPPDVALDPSKLEDPSQRQRMFDCLSWRSFIALNWPASDRRGEPDPAAKFWNPGADFDGYQADSRDADLADYHPRTRVWETYKEVYELFQTGKGRFDWNPATQQPPLHWDDPPPAPKGRGCEAVGDDKVLMMAHKNRTPLPPAGQGVVNESVQAFAGQFGVVVDQNGKLMRYEVRMNRSEYEFVLANGYATTANVTPGGPASVLGTHLTLPDNRSLEYGQWGGSIELKGAWKELCTDSDCAVVDDPSRYFTEQVWIYQADETNGKNGKNDENDNRGMCRQALMGLAGMHIAHKTHWAPQWVWSTFEHIDLVPENPDHPGDASTALFNPECVQKAKELMCEKKPFLAADPCCPNVPFDKKRFPTNTPNQVTRLQAIGSEAAALNATFARLAGGSPFENYVLIDTQWPFQGRDPEHPNEIFTRPCNADVVRGQLDSECYTIVPQFLRNTSMESFMASYYRPNEPLHQFSNRGCMNCHAEAGADFSYLWLDAVNQRVQSVVP